MKKCPVCGNCLERLLCSDCGFDASRNYECFPTFVKLPSSPEAISALRENRNALHKDKLCCPDCGKQRFYVSLSLREFVCAACGKKLTENSAKSLQSTQSEINDQNIRTTASAISPHDRSTRFPNIPAQGCRVIATGNNWKKQCDVGSWNNIVAIAAGSIHTVGLRTLGTVAATGSNSEGQCDTSHWRNIQAIAAGAFHTVGLKKNGTVVAVGDQAYYKCAVDRWENIKAIAAGNNHTVGLRADGTVVATGSNSNGQCGVKGWSGITAVACGRNHTVGLKDDGTVIAVGDNKHGQCRIQDWSKIVAIAAGENQTVGLREDGSIVVAGNHSMDDYITKDWRSLSAIAAGWGTTAAIRTDGTVVSTYRSFQISNWQRIGALALGSAHIVGLVLPEKTWAY